MHAAALSSSQAPASPPALGTYCCAVLVAFSILYNLSFQAYPSVSSGRISVILALLWIAISGRSMRGMLDGGILPVFLPLPYVLAQLAFTGDPGQLSRFLHLALYSYIGAAALARLVDNAETLLSVIIVAVVVQSVVLIYSFFSLDYRAWVGSTLLIGANFEATDLYRAPGFTSNAGSALSVVQSMGVLAGGFLLHLRRLRGCPDAESWVWAAMVLCGASCIVVGRTGTILSALFLFAFLRSSRQALMVMAWLGAVAFAIGSMLAAVLDDLLPSNFSADYFLSWAFGFVVGDDATARTLDSMPIRALGVDMLFGEGLVSLVDGLNPSGHDSGFVQAYFSMGFVVSGAFYLAYAVVLLRLLGWLPWRLRFLLAAVFFGIEVKEPFLFNYSTMFVLVAIYTLTRKRRRVPTAVPPT